MSNQFKLKVTQDTFLTLYPEAPSGASETQRYAVKAGSEYPVANFHEVDDLFFRLAFGSKPDGNQTFFAGSDGVSRNTWCIFEGHCILLNANGSPAHQFTQKLHLKLQDFLDHDLNLGLEAINQNKVLAIQVQEKLISLGFLASRADGQFGPISAGALKQFQTTLKLEEGFLGKQTAEKLLNIQPKDLPQPEVHLGGDLASRIVKYMQEEDYKVAVRPNEFNIVYLEGSDQNGKPNADLPNAFNDRRLLIAFENGQPKIVGNWEATTEPGSHYTYRPISQYARRNGAARIKFGQYKAWRIGIHGTAEPHEALVQVDNISVHRDLNKDAMRTGDRIDTNYNFAINQHWGYDFPKNNIMTASAGCLVGRTRKGHRDFMATLKKDQRYRLNSKYLFETTIIAGDDLQKRFPG
ncbi:MAG: peptidoglycan-binding domain-containing protein [Cyanobacteria bacterium J06560_2]